MSILKQPGVYALIYVNPPEITKRTGTISVVRVCYGGDQDAISVAYTLFEDGSKGFCVPQSNIWVNGRMQAVPMISGELLADLVAYAGWCQGFIKKNLYGQIPTGAVIKVYKKDGSPVVEVIPPEEMERAA